MKRLPALCLIALLGTAALPAQEAAAGPEMKDADQKKVGRHIGKWFEAKLKGDITAVEKAKADLISECADFDKKPKAKPILSLVRDWEAILDAGRDYPTSGAEVKKGKAFDLDLGGGNRCAVRLPAAYNPKKENYPGVLVLTAGKAVEALEAMPEGVKDQFVLLGVDLTGLDADSLLADAGRVRLLLPIGGASRYYRMDRKRLFLLGQGDFGAAAASRLAAVYPMAFAGCALVDGTSAATKNAGNLKLLPFQPVADTPAALAWFLEQKPREAYPLAFEATLTETWQGRYYWVQALRFDPPEAVPADKVARFKVSVDRATNTITIDSEFIYQFQLFLNDAIVDLSQPVKILRNGEPHVFQATRSISTLLDNFESTLDAGMVFPAVVRRVDVPAAPGSSQAQGR